ncbi:MAG: ABC transporter ATP-binding protein/permease [Peptococcaceae bacterium]|jgi:ATP-binding cassette subfamily C protein|nr:ABC transporter ATP-binding protein/permease [Peptococcaceae bacterium]
MMMDKRLLRLSGKTRKYIYLCVLFQWLGLVANVGIIFALARLLGQLYAGEVSDGIQVLLAAAGIGLPVRFLCAILSSKMSYLAASGVKAKLHERIYQKLLRLGLAYQKYLSTAEAVQLSGEGVEQLEIYFAKYLPQFLYSLVAPVTLFGVLSFVCFKAAAVLLVCVPLIPLAIVFVQKLARKLFQQYWGEYTALGDGFLENVQGLTTLKIYQADERKNQEMNVQAERFRKITMRVLTMQLQSIMLMDVVAFAGAALGAVIALWELAAGQISLAACVMLILLSAEFFIPLRQLGSYFHVAMNGIAASAKMFRLLDIPEKSAKTATVSAGPISLRNLSFAYDEGREVLHSVSLDVPPNTFTAIVGKSGSGKSTLAALLTGANTGYSGSLTVGGEELSAIREDSLLRHITLIGHQSHLFAGTVRENLRLSLPTASDARMIEVLGQVKLWDFLRGNAGLDTRLTENAANLSGGQRQRMALARALLRDSEVLILDEATSNIDVESETDIMNLVTTLARTKTVIVISHRLANVAHADCIYVLEDGRVSESGVQAELLRQNKQYARLWREQRELEEIRGEAV